MSGFQAKFGTDGIRGIANEELSPDLCLRVGLAAGSVFAKSSPKPVIVIGRDTRRSGDFIEGALVAGLTSMGCQVVSIDIAPTPAISFSVRQMSATAGIVISASHNPFSDNGIKFFGADGRKLNPTLEAQIESAIPDAFHLTRAGAEHIGAVHHDLSLRENYLSWLQDHAPDLTGLTLVLDCANGATFELGPKLFSACGADVIPLYTEPNGLNINRDCGSTHPEALCAKVRETGAHAGLAFDGDGDRVILCDEKGGVVHGDHILYLCAAGMHRRGELNSGAVVATIMSNAGLEVALERIGISLERTDVGDKYVAERLAFLGSSLGGERSGHILFPQISPTGDGMLTGLLVLKEMQNAGVPLSTKAAEVKELPQTLVGVKVQDKHAWQEDEELQNLIAEYSDQLGKPEWLSVRASGTEPLLRIMIQGENRDFVDQAILAIAGHIQDTYGISG